MSRIDTVALRNGTLKWCALSRDMIWCEHRQTLTKDTTVWRGKYRFGDSIYVSGLGWYEVRDCMNARWKQKIDILSYTRVGMTESAIVELEIKKGCN
jgi:3D (Asp-Asp-Asp) domain-containing protein